MVFETRLIFLMKLENIRESSFGLSLMFFSIRRPSKVEDHTIDLVYSMCSVRPLTSLYRNMMML